MDSHSITTTVNRELTVGPQGVLPAKAGDAAIGRGGALPAWTTGNSSSSGHQPTRTLHFMDALTVTPSVDLHAFGPPERLVAFSPALDGCVYLAFAREDIAPLRLDVVGEPGATLRQPTSFRVLRLRDGIVEAETVVEDEPNDVRLVQPYDDGLLLVSPFCQDGEPNARFYDREGNFRSSMNLGSWIVSIHTTPRGLIWATYSDCSTVDTNHTCSVVGSGVVLAWDPRGLFPQYGARASSETMSADCSAANLVSETELWSYCYSEFELCRDVLGAGSCFWDLHFGPANALAVGGNHALLVSSEHPSARCALYFLWEGGHKNQAQLIRSFALLDEAGQPLPCDQARGQGATLHVLGNHRLYALSIESLVPEVVGDGG